MNIVCSRKAFYLQKNRINCCFLRVLLNHSPPLTSESTAITEDMLWPSIFVLLSSFESSSDWIFCWSIELFKDCIRIIKRAHQVQNLCLVVICMVKIKCWGIADSPLLLFSILDAFIISFKRLSDLFHKSLSHSLNIDFTSALSISFENTDSNWH